MTGSVAVENQSDFIRESFDDPNVFFVQGDAQARHDVAKSDLPGGDHIGVALDNGQAARFCDLVTYHIQGVQRFTLGEQPGFR